MHSNESTCRKLDVLGWNKSEGEPLIVVFHVYDVKARHKDTKVVDNFEQWIYFMYIYPRVGKVKLVRGKFHEYFSVPLDYTTKGEVKIDMRKYVKNMIDEFPINIEKSQAVTSPATKNLFEAN